MGDMKIIVEAIMLNLKINTYELRDAVNEKGLGIAGLNFPNNANYNDEKSK